MRAPEFSLDGSPHQLEQRLEDYELSSRQQRAARAVGKFALRLGEVTYSKLEGLHQKIGDFYGSVPESIKNLDLTTGVEAKQSSLDDDSGEGEDQDSADSSEEESLAGEVAEEAEPFPEHPDEPEEEPIDEGEPIEEDTNDNWDDMSEARQAVNERLREAGINGATISEVSEILDSDRTELIHTYLRNIGIEKAKVEETAHLLTPLNLYLKKLEELGLPKEKMHEAQHFLTEEVGRLRLKHLVELIGEGKESELRELMSIHHNDLLAAELERIGIEESTIQEVIDTPRRNKTQLTRGALKALGLSDELIDDVETIVLKAEIPEDIAAEAEVLGIPLETIVKARDAFKRAEWQDTFDYLKIALRNEEARERLREHGIEIEPAPGTDGEKKTKLTNLSLKEIHEKYPEEWEAERVRRISVKRAELAEMLRRFRAYLPLEDLPLPADVEIDPEMEIPQDPEDAHHIGRAYGVWRDLLAKSYAKRINDPQEYKSVRAELHRVGGPSPLMRRLGQRWLAIKILNSEKRQRREVGDRANFGAFGMGYKRYKEIFRNVEQADTDVKDARRALGAWHKNAFVADGQATPRVKLAENIIDIRLRELAFRNGRLNPEIPRQRIDLTYQHEELVV